MLYRQNSIICVRTLVIVVTSSVIVLHVYLYISAHSRCSDKLTSLFSLYPKGHRPMRKIHVESFYIHYD